MNRTLRIALIAGAAVTVAVAVLAVSQIHTAAAPAPEAPRRSTLTVTTTAPQMTEWPQELRASGALAAWQEMVVSAEVGSLRITELSVDVGSVVARGQELVRLSQDSVRAELRKQEASVAQAKATLAQAQADAKRARLVKDSGALSDQKITEYLIAEETARASLASAEAGLESARITLARTSIKAADDGVVTSRSATLGTVVSAGTELYRLLRQGRVEWQAELDARQVDLVRPGQKARLTLPGGGRVEGEVRMVSPTLNAGTSRAIAYVALPAGGGARVGNYASGVIELDAKPALTLPQSAIVLRDGRSYVFTVGGDNRTTRLPVTCGRRRGDRVEVLTGLEAQTRVVESGGAFLADGALVTVAPEVKS